MATEHPKLKLGKRAAFVKTRLKQLPQEEETWEADFRATPKPVGQTETHYLGVVATLKGDPIQCLPIEYTPNVNDLADLLADAMRRPMVGSAHRPEHIRFRDNPRWTELYRHLNEIGITTSIHSELPKAEEFYEDFLREMRKSQSKQIIMVSSSQRKLADQFPAISKWVQGYGHIEIGDQEGFGFVVRAIDYGGEVFQDNKPNTLAEAMAALEKGLEAYFEDEGIEVKE